MIFHMPCCGYRPEGTVFAGRRNCRAQPRDIIVCIFCTGLLICDAGNNLREITKDEYNKLSEKMRAELSALQANLLATPERLPPRSHLEVN